MPLFELTDASARYNGREVLRGVTLRIDQGERVALVGRSGAGKSTLLRLLYEQHKNDTALVPQELGLVMTLSVFHNVYMGGLARHSAFYNLANLIRPLTREVDGIAALTERLGLGEKLFTPAGELSGGQQQRTAIGRAFWRQSPILFGDEPVSALDEHQSRDMMRAMTDGHETVVLAMHDVDLALAFTDRIIGVQDGHIGLDEPTAGMSRSDLDPFYQHDA